MGPPDTESVQDPEFGCYVPATSSHRHHRASQLVSDVGAEVQQLSGFSHEGYFMVKRHTTESFRDPTPPHPNFSLSELRFLSFSLWGTGRSYQLQILPSCLKADVSYSIRAGRQRRWPEPPPVWICDVTLLSTQILTKHGDVSGFHLPSQLSPSFRESGRGGEGQTSSSLEVCPIPTVDSAPHLLWLDTGRDTLLSLHPTRLLISALLSLLPNGSAGKSHEDFTPGG